MLNLKRTEIRTPQNAPSEGAGPGAHEVRVEQRQRLQSDSGLHALDADGVMCWAIERGEEIHRLSAALLEVE